MSQRWFVILSLFLDALCIIGAALLAYFIRFAGFPPAYNFNAFLIAAPFMLAAYYFAGWIFDLYDSARVDTAWGIMRSVFLTSIAGALLTAFVLFLGGEATAPFARATFLLAIALIFLLLIIWRLAFMRLGSISWPRQQILILGTGEMALNLARNLEKYHERHIELLGFVGMDTDCTASSELTERAPVHGDWTDLLHIIERTGANRLIISVPADSRRIVEAAALVAGKDIVIDIVPGIYEILFASTDSIVGDIPLIHATGKRNAGYENTTKRIFDLFLSAVFLVLGAPIMIITALAIKLDDGGPIFYFQERVGKNGRLFKVVKFRTMRTDAESSTGPVLAQDDDERITKVGKILRHFRIDELPQIFNVARGRMSFIGPRPERPFFTEQFIQEIEGYSERLRVRPGITGLAQINGGYATTPQLKLKYDLMYVYHQSFLLDLQVIAETIKVVLTGRGAR